MARHYGSRSATTWATNYWNKVVEELGILHARRNRAIRGRRKNPPSRKSKQGAARGKKMSAKWRRPLQQMSNKELQDELEWAYDSYYETKAQHQGETSAYGDSWPGAQGQLSRALGGIREIERELARRSTRPRDTGRRRGSSEFRPFNYDDIPF
jgi:hypothetical protein